MATKTKTTSAKKNTKSEKEDPLFELFFNELKDIYWGEKAITKALPKMIKAAENEELSDALEEHLEVTKGHIERLEEVFSIIEKKAQGKKCEGLSGIIEEGEQLISEFKKSAALDAAIIASAQKVEHYEISSYGTLRTFAGQLGLNEAVDLLQETLDEEAEADEKLTEIAESAVNMEAHVQE